MSRRSPFHAILVFLLLSPCVAASAPPAGGCRATTGAAPLKTRHPAGRMAGRVSGVEGRPFGVRVSSRGTILVTQQDENAVTRVRLGTLAKVGEAIRVGADPGDVVVTRDGGTAYVSNFKDGSVHVIDVASGRRLRSLQVGRENAYRMALSPDDTRLYVTSGDGGLYAVDLARDDAIDSLAIDGRQGLAMSRDGGTLFVTGVGGRVSRVDACTLAVQASATLEHHSAQDVALSHDETELYVAAEWGAVEVLDAVTLELLRELRLPELRPFGLAITPDGAQLYVASPSTGHIAIVDPRSGRVTTRHEVRGTPRRIAFSRTGAVAVVSNEGNWVDVIR